MVSTRSKNSRAIAPTGSLNTFPKKFANAAIKFQSATNASIAKLTNVPNKFMMNAPATAKAPVIMPIALILLPVTLFIAATTAKSKLTSRITPAIITSRGLVAHAVFSMVCAAAHRRVAPAQIFAQLASNTRIPIALPIPIISGAMISRLFAIQLIPSSSGCNAMMAMLVACVHTSAQVIGMLSNLALVSSAAANIAFLTISAVICPSAAISRSSPVVTPR